MAYKLDYETFRQEVKKLVEERCKFAHIMISEAGGITTVYAYDGGIVVAY